MVDAFAASVHAGGHGNEVVDVMRANSLALPAILFI
jgi:hypothetical protein